MTTQPNNLFGKEAPGTTSMFSSVLQQPASHLKTRKLYNLNQLLFDWKHLATSIPLAHLLQPDFYTVFRFSSPDTPVYQQNLHLDFGESDLNFRSIQKWIRVEDRQHIHRIDRVVTRFSLECLLQPFDCISSVIIQINHPEKGKIYCMRKTTILKCDERGLPSYGIMSLKDITAMVTNAKPNNVDITFSPDHVNLCHELWKRINKVLPRRISITPREKEIVSCLYNGMSSKQIASALYISKATVDTHRQNIIRKWEVTNTAGLMKRAFEEGCI